jgi:branched-chain amino acid transport system substrate-binding protein
LRFHRFLTVGCVVAAAGAGVVACGGNDNSSSGGGGGGSSSGGELHIYSSLPLEGASRGQATALVDGMKLALEQAGGKAGNFNIKYISLSDASAQAGSWTPEATQQNARKAAQDDSVAAYIGEFNSGASAVSIPILNEAGDDFSGGSANERVQGGGCRCAVGCRRRRLRWR